MRNLMKICLLLAVGFILSACSTDPVTTNQGSEPSDYIEVYSNEGIQDSMPVGAFLYDYLDLGVLDFTNSDSIKFSFDYIAYNTLTYRFYAYYHDENFNEVHLGSIDVSGSQNTYKHVEFTAPSPNSSKMFYYFITRTSPADSYMVTRNFKVSKK